MARHLIGLLLATEEDWPAAFETVLERLGPVRYRGETHGHLDPKAHHRAVRGVLLHRLEFPAERILNQPFDLRYTPRYGLVIDRLAWWYDLPREWLKKMP